MESALVVFVSEILLARCAHSFDFWYVNNSCVNTVRQHFPWSILYLFTFKEQSIPTGDYNLSIQGQESPIHSRILYWFEKIIFIQQIQFRSFKKFIFIQQNHMIYSRKIYS